MKGKTDVLFPSVSELKLREGLFLLSLLSPAAGLLADAQSLESVRVTLNILVRNESYQPVVNARIRISRLDRSASGSSHPEVEGFTDAEGKFVRPNTDFQLTGPPFQLTVTARSFESSRMVLTDEMLREGLKSGRLFSTVLLKPLSAGAPDEVEPGVANVEADPGVLPASSGSPATPTSSGSFFKDLYGGARPSIFLPWILGAVVLVILQTAALAWLLRSRMRLSGPESTDHYLRTMTRALEGLKRAQEQSLVQQKDLLAQIVSNNDILLNGVSIISIHEESSQANFAIHPASAPEAAGAPLLVDERSAHISLSEAQQSYLKLIDRTPMAREPVYLDIEGARSSAGRLEDTTVYLESVPHSQGAFVLFTNHDAAGWVFPNPTIGWRKIAIKDVFPALTETEFALAKADILPRRAEKVSARRWRVTDL